MVQKGAGRPGEEDQVISGHTRRQDLKPARHLLESREALTLFQGSVEPEVTGVKGCSREPAPDLVCKGRGQAPPPATGSSGSPRLECLGPAESSSGLGCCSLFLPGVLDPTPEHGTFLPGGSFSEGCPGGGRRGLRICRH